MRPISVVRLGFLRRWKSRSFLTDNTKSSRKRNPLQRYSLLTIPHWLCCRYNITASILPQVAWYKLVEILYHYLIRYLPEKSGSFDNQRVIYSQAIYFHRETIFFQFKDLLRGFVNTGKFFRLLVYVLLPIRRLRFSILRCFLPFFCQSLPTNVEIFNNQKSQSRNSVSQQI